MKILKSDDPDLPPPYENFSCVRCSTRYAALESEASSVEVLGVGQRLMTVICPRCRGKEASRLLVNEGPTS